MFRHQSHSGRIDRSILRCLSGEMACRQEYRRFNIKDIQPGDDYAAIRQATFRRYEKVASGESIAPTLILIDGGKGQLAMAVSALAELGLGYVPVIGVAKGESRKPGLEFLIFPDERKPVQLAAEHPALHLIQEIRDEAHVLRFQDTEHVEAKPDKHRNLTILPASDPSDEKR